MEPNTATRLRERKSNKLRDFLSMCGPLGVSHLMVFSQKNARDSKPSTSGGSGSRARQQEAIGNINLRIARAPRGPTVTFRINKFALAKDVVKAQRRSHAPGGEFQTAPLLVLNNFGSAEKQVKLLVSVFQGLFPPIHVQSMHLSEARRIVLLNYNAQTQTIDYRHFLISVRPVGVSRRVRRVIEGSSSLNKGGSKKIPNLASAGDISEYLLGQKMNNNGQAEDNTGFETDASSASEVDSDVDEDGTPRNHVQLPDGYVGRGNIRDTQRAVRLRELGPRMELRCVKIEEGIPGAGKDAKGSSGGNEVLWHAYVQKSSAESINQRKEMAKKEQEREARRAKQEANVARKKAEKEMNQSNSKKETAIESNGENQDENIDASDEEELQEAEDDEFAYEDMHGDGDLFEDEDAELDDDASAGEISDEEEEEEEEDHSDLSPIEIDDEDDFSDGEIPAKRSAHKRPAPKKGKFNNGRRK